jgi:hypothetical protein
MGFDSDYLYFVNNSDLTIELNFQSINKDLMFAKAEIITLDGDVYSNEYNTPLTAQQEVNLILDLGKFESNGSFYSNDILVDEEAVMLVLNITEINGDSYSDDGIPSSVIIVLYNPEISLENDVFFNYQDNPQPITLETIFVPNLEYNNTFLGLEEYLISYTIRDEKNEILEKVDKKNFYSFSELSRSISLDYLGDYVPGSYSFSFEFSNIAGSNFKEDFQVIVEEEYLNINLLTSDDDNSLTYFYNDNKELYGNKIFTGGKNFTFSVQTNKQAICYINYESIGSQYSGSQLLFSEDISQRMNLDPISFIHSIEINPFLLNATTKYFWLGCTDMSGFEKMTLHSSLEFLNNPIENLQFIYHDEELILNLIYPTDSLLTNNIFTTRLSSSTKAVCNVAYDTQEKEILSSDYLDHQSQFNLENGNYTLKYTCVDILNKNKTLNKDIEIDNTKGVKINTDEIYFSAKNSFDLTFTTSSVTESCRYAREPKSTDEYESFALIGSNTNSFAVTLSPLVPNENKYFITCKSGIFSTKELTIIFDQSGPQLNNLSFKTDGFSNPSYVSEFKKGDILFDVTTRIPIETYSVELVGTNKTENFNISGSSKTGEFEEELSISEVLGEFNSIKISAQNSLGKTGNTLTKQLLVDKTKPEVRLLKNGSSWVMTCIDIETQCSKILYGFSNLEIQCNPSYTYKKGDLIDHTDNAFICARAINNVGLISEITSSATGVQIKVGDDGSVIVVPVPVPEDGVNPFENDLDENKTIEEEPVVDVEPTPGQNPSEIYTPEEENSTTIIVLSALAVILLLAGGSGYYAYKKGYLNSQLQKLGIKLPNQPSGMTTGTSSTGGYYSPMDKSKNGGVPKLVGSNNDKKSKYDEHLSKLNSFLDETLDKKKGVFDSFKPTQKGRVESYEDTLARSRKGTIKKDQDFDDFYKASSSNKSSSSSEDEADKFEQYYKNKKEKKNTNGSDEKNKKKKQ